MPTMPTRDSLPNLRTQVQSGVVRAPRDFIGPALEQVGSQISRAAQIQKQKTDELSLATARADFQTGLIDLSAQADPHQNPDQSKWKPTFDCQYAAVSQAGARQDTDPNLQARF